VDELEKESGKTKKPYLKPEVKKVPLRPEEAVLGGCLKAASGGGPVSANCNPLTCLTQGS
jgi:hypothetical protein